MEGTARELNPRMLDSLPLDATGRVYALHDLDRGAEVLGSLIACWPDRGPTWMVRLHEPLAAGTTTTVCLYDRPSSKLGRWHVSREVPMAKAEQYASLVRARKQFDAETAFGLTNPA